MSNSRFSVPVFVTRLQPRRLFTNTEAQSQRGKRANLMDPLSWIHQIRALPTLALGLCIVIQTFVSYLPQSLCGAFPSRILAVFPRFVDCLLKAVGCPCC